MQPENKDAGFIKVAPTAFSQAQFRTVYEIPYSQEVLAQMKQSNLSGLEIPNQPFIIPTFEARYKGTDRVLRKAIEQDHINQVVELASGMSPQGMIFTKEYPELSYLETDLGDMVENKERIVSNVLGSTPANLHFAAVNCLDDKAFNDALNVFNHSKPLAVFNIGLMSYLTIDEKKIMAKNIHAILTKFGGVWITPDPAMHNERRQGMFQDDSHREKVDGMIANRTGTNYQEKAFANEADTDQSFVNAGFHIEKVPQVSGYELMSPNKLGLDQAQKDRIQGNLDRYGKVWVLSVS
jgi:O-methyltransferase involved in polyketide biosynthesis